MKTPVALFAYNRPEHTRIALDALSMCRRIADCEFYLFSDGPSNNDVKAEVDATREVLHDWANVFNAKVIEQPLNLGLAKSIVMGVSELCKQYGRVIVIEDDLIVSPDFLHYMIQSLDHYENEAQVMQVGGYTLSPPSGITDDAFILPVTTTWGWGTWQRAWECFSWKPADLETAKSDKNWCQLFDLNGTCSFTSMLEDRMAGRNDSWGILWWYAVSRQNGLVVYPSQSLVWNGGFDGSGVHCGSGDFLVQGDASNYLQSSLPSSLAFPPDTRFEPAHLFLLEEFFRSRLAGGQTEQDGASAKMHLNTVAKKIIGKLRNALY
ncbi:glycosyltransferase [Pseudomonadota bacterium]